MIQFKSTLLVLILISLYSNIQAQTCHPDDLASLIRLRDATNGGGGAGSWNNAVNLSLGTPWTGTNVADWHGIDTIHDPINTPFYRVRKINLHGGDFSGIQRLENNIPDSLFVDEAFRYLDSLDLSNNQLAGVDGDIKTGVPIMNHTLSYLNLNNNSLNRNSADVFINLLSSFDNITEVHMDNALNTGSSPFKFYNLPTSSSIGEVHLEQNGFTDTLKLHDLINATWEQLKDIYFDNNNFTAIDITVSAGNSNLQYLSVHDNDVQSFNDIANCLEFIPSLFEFQGSSVMDANLGHELILNGSNFPSLLNTVYLPLNGLTGSLPLEFFEDIPFLKILKLSDNNLSGPLPTPAGAFATGDFTSEIAYEGTSNIEYLYLHNNNLNGSLHLDWLFLSQMNYDGGNGGDVPLKDVDLSNNDFQEIYPQLIAPSIPTVLANYGARFSYLESVSVAGNAFDFKALFRLKEFFRFKQISIALNDHYIPQVGLIPNDFNYSPQDSIGIGGVKRRNSGDSLVIEAGRNIVENGPSGQSLLLNKYTWERDSLGALLSIGSVLPGGGFSGVGGVGGPGYQPANGFLGDPLQRHTLGIKNLDVNDHNDQSYTACVSNDSFPNLVICLKKKKVQVGPCTDSTGNPIQCQVMIVQFHPDTMAQYSPAQQDSVRQATREETGATPIASCVCGELELWEISDTASTMTEANGKGTRESTTQASAKPQLLSAEPNYSLMASNSGPLPDTVDLPSGSGNTSATTLVAIIDSGFDYEYQDLLPYISEGASDSAHCMQDAVWGWNFLKETNNASDDHGHGTAIAGIVAGLSKQNLIPETNPGSGQIGIVPLKYTDKKGAGTVFNAACAMYYAADYTRPTSSGQTAKVRVINNSWGYYGEPSNILEYTIQYAAEECDILVVASAGNNGIQVSGADSLMHWPSNSVYDPNDDISADNILSVAAVDNHNSNTLSSYSNYDNTFIDIAAQGSDSTTQAGSVDGFVEVNGTSFATAQVSRAAALLIDKYPDASYWAIKYALINGVDILQSNDSLRLSSKGRLNYQKADSIMNIIQDRTLCSDQISVLNVRDIELIDATIALYPNPVNDNLNIEIDRSTNYESIDINIYNIHGQLIQQEIIANQTEKAILNLEKLPQGIYFVQFNIGNKQISKKIIKL